MPNPCQSVGCLGKAHAALHWNTDLCAAPHCLQADLTEGSREAVTGSPGTYFGRAASEGKGAFVMIRVLECSGRQPAWSG